MRVLSLALVLAVVAAPALAHADGATRRVPDPWTAVPDVLEAPPPSEGGTLSRALTAGSVGAFYAAFGTWAYFAWYYHHHRNPSFVSGGDGWFGKSTYAGGADKLGHFWANMTLTRLSYQILRAGHWKPTPAKVIAAGWSALFFFLVEVKDGYFYAFSYGDETANLLGAAVAVALESSPKLDRLLDFRVEYWPSVEYRAIVNGEVAGADVNSANVAEDYSGQTYLLAAHLGAIHGLGDGKWTRLSRYVDAVVGYRTEHYKPDLNDGTMRGLPTEELSLGLSLNLQGVIDDALAGHGARRHLRAVGHALTEVFNPPFGSLRGNVATRSTDHHATE